MGLLLKIDQIVGLVKLGIATASSIIDAVKAGKLAAQDAQGKTLTAADVEVAVNAAQAEALKAGDKAHGHVEGRHPNG